MHLSWLGHSAFKIETKTPLRDEVVILINPYNVPKADLPRNLKSDLVLLTHGTENTITLSGEPFVVASPGEYEIKGVMVYAIAIPNGEKNSHHLIYHFETENLSLVYLGSFKEELNDELVDKLGAIDLLLLPCGGSLPDGRAGSSGGKVLNAEQADNLVTQLEPRLVIPHSFNPPGRHDPFEPVDKFARLLGQKEKEWLPKFKVAKKDLPQEETRLILLEKT